MSGIIKGKQARRSEQEWDATLSRFERSRLSVEAFCRREALSVASFYRWKNLLRPDREVSVRSHQERVPAFVDLGALKPITAHRPQLDLKLDLGDGLVLHLVRH